MSRLSIITINFNNKKGLKKTIESVLNQEFTDYEFIIIDGGSSDGSVEEIKLAADKLAYWISEPDRGIYHAMNKGIREASGEYCLFLNSGDYLLNKSVLKKIFEKPFDEDIIYGDALIDNMHQSFPAKLTLSFLITKAICHQSTILRRSLFEVIGPYNEDFKIRSDWEFCLKAIFLKSCSYKYLNGLVISRMNAGGISQQNKYEAIRTEETEKTIKNLIIPILKQKINNPEDYDEINKVFMKLFLIRDSKLVKLALRIEQTKVFNILRKIYYQISFH